MNIERQKIQEDGTLEAGTFGLPVVLGFWWWEPINERFQFRRNWMVWPLYPLLFTGPAFLWSLGQKGLVWDPVSILVFYSAPATIFWEMAAFIPYWTDRLHEVAAVRFHRDGAISVTELRPFFGPREARFKNLRLSWHELMSVEMAPVPTQGGGHFRFDGGMFAGDPYLAFLVRLYFRSGETYTCAELMEEHEARIIVAQLNEAWQTMRMASTMHAYGSPATDLR